ncbi:MAG: DUF502 domain-containing protein [Phycisphaerales bacterium]
MLTLWLLWQAAGFVFANVAEPINRGIRLTTMTVMPNLFAEGGEPRKWYNIHEPDWWRVDAIAISRFQSGREQLGLQPVDPAIAVRDIRRARFREFWGQHWYLEGAGLVVAVALIYTAGILVTNYLGRAIYTRVEKWIAQIPGFKQIYPHVKQVVDMVMGDRPMAFKRVVLVQYPRQGIWTLGLATSDSFREARRAAQADQMVSIFIPSTPTPFTGFIINVPAKDVVETTMTIDQAIRFVVTAGLLSPDDKLVAKPPAAATANETSAAQAGRSPPPGDADAPPPPDGSATAPD